MPESTAQQATTETITSSISSNISGSDFGSRHSSHRSSSVSSTDSFPHSSTGSSPSSHPHAVPPSLSESGVPIWQSDDDVDHCALCGKQFTFFVRRHHCRLCGRICCASCASNFMRYLPNTYVVSPPSQIFLESPHVPHRTCTECTDELDMIRHALREGSGSILNDSAGNSLLSRDNNSSAVIPNMLVKSSSEHVTTTEMSTSSSQVTLTNNLQGEQGSSDQPIRQRQPKSKTHTSNRSTHEDPACPVCGKFLGFLNETQREEHTNQCLEAQNFSCSPQSRRTYNRMLVSTIPKNADVNKLQLNEDNECIICMEGFKPGDKIGRLECLCCFHYKCIRDWFKHKGRCECPVHVLHYDNWSNTSIHKTGINQCMHLFLWYTYKTRWIFRVNNPP